MSLSSIELGKGKQDYKQYEVKSLECDSLDCESLTVNGSPISLTKYYSLVYNSFNSSILTDVSGPVKIPYDSPGYDPDSMLDVGNNSIVLSRDGVWKLSVSLLLTSTNIGVPQPFKINLYVNGSSFGVRTVTIDRTVITFGFTFNFLQNDIVTVEISKNAGNIIPDGIFAANLGCTLEAELIAE